jgi:hypothetical protein
VDLTADAKTDTLAILILLASMKTNVATIPINAIVELFAEILLVVMIVIVLLVTLRSQLTKNTFASI